MKIAHQVNQKMVERLTANTAVQTVTFEGLKNLLYREAYSQKVEDNTYLIMISEGCNIKNIAEFITMGRGFGVNEILLPPNCVMWNHLPCEETEIAREQGIKICLVVPYSDIHQTVISWYESAAEINEIDGIALEIGGGVSGDWERFKLIHYLVKSGKFNVKKEHRLIGMINPAEMVAYRRAFSDFIYGSISIAITDLCISYSVHGICLSRENGVYYKPVNLPFIDEMDTMSLSPEQESLYFLNQEIMDEFARGLGGDRLMQTYDDYGKQQMVGVGIELGDKR